VVVTIDLDPPMLKTLAPPNGSLQQDTLRVYGIAGDQYAFESIMIKLGK
jgi:hypothetical protein